MTLYEKFEIEKLNEYDKKLFYGGKFSTHEEQERLLAYHNIKSRRKAMTMIQYDVLDDLKFRKLNQMLLIKMNNKRKLVWDLMITLFSTYSCVSCSYYAAFDFPYDFKDLLSLEILIECCFFIDMFLRCCSSFRDSDTLEIIEDVFHITKNYFHLIFWLDLIAIIPFQYIFENDKVRIVKLLRVSNISRFFSRFSEQQIYNLLERFLDSKSTQNKMKYVFISKYIYKILNLIIIAVCLTYYIGCLWYIIVNTTCTEPCDDPYAQTRCFSYYYDLADIPDYRKLILCCYFILTTLATVGYGDYAPQSDNEKVAAIFILLMGIALFSYILSNFADVLVTYDKKIGVEDRSANLQVWIISLNRISSKPLPKDLVPRIYKHFNFYWKNNRLISIKENDQYMSIMTGSQKKEMIKHLFEDVFYQLFRAFFLIKGKEYHDYRFYYEMAFALFPRKYYPGEKVLRKGEEIHEIHFITEGEVQLSFFHEGEKIKRFFGKGYYFGDYQIITDKRAEFDYEAITPLKTIVLAKNDFINLIDKYDSIRENMKTNGSQFYKETIKSMVLSLKETLIEKRKVDMTFEEVLKIFKAISIREEDAAQEETQGTGFTGLLSIIKNVQKEYEFSKTLENHLDDVSNILLKIRENFEKTLQPEEGYNTDKGKTQLDKIRE